MPRLREQYDGDRYQRNPAIEYPSSNNRFEVSCSACGRPLFVDEETKLQAEKEVGRDLDNAFTCSTCEQDYDRLAFE